MGQTHVKTVACLFNVCGVIGGRRFCGPQVAQRGFFVPPCRGGVVAFLLGPVVVTLKCQPGLLGRFVVKQHCRQAGSVEHSNSLRLQVVCGHPAHVLPTDQLLPSQRNMTLSHSHNVRKLAS